MFLSKPFISKVKSSIQPLSSVTNTLINNNKCSFTTTTPTKHLSLNNNTTKIPNVNVLLRPKKSPSTLNKKIDKPQKFFTPKTVSLLYIVLKKKRINIYNNIIIIIINFMKKFKFQKHKTIENIYIFLSLLLNYLILNILYIYIYNIYI